MLSLGYKNIIVLYMLLQRSPIKVFALKLLLCMRFSHSLRHLQIFKFRSRVTFTISLRTILMYPNKVSLYVLTIDYLLREMEFNCSCSCVFAVLLVILRLGRFYSNHVCVLQSPQPPSSPALLFPVMIACLAIPCH